MFKLKIQYLTSLYFTERHFVLIFKRREMSYYQFELNRPLSDY